MINKINIRNFKCEDGNWILPNSRAYFDIYSQQFTKSSIPDKLNILGFLIQEGMDLTDIIIRYCDNHSDHIVEAVKPTISAYIQSMRWGETIHYTDEFFDEMSEVEITILLQDEINLRYTGGEIYYSDWGDSIALEIARRAENSSVIYGEILRGIEFSKEFLYKSNL